MRRIGGSAIFIRLGARLRPYHTAEAVDKSSVKDILIKNVQGERINGYGCSITGLPGNKVEGISISDITLEFENGGKILDKNLGITGDMSEEERRNEVERVVPERERSYPGGKMYRRLPSYGFFIRHAENIRLDNIRMAIKDRDIRPAIICDDVDRFTIRNLQAESAEGTESLLRFKNVRSAVLEGCTPMNGIPTFLSVESTDSKEVTLINNQTEKAGQEIMFLKR